LSEEFWRNGKLLDEIQMELSHGIDDLTPNHVSLARMIRDEVGIWLRY
jgi:hypothetical protein